MRGGQPPLAPKSSHKVLRSFPPPHRLRGKPLKIPKKPRPPTVIPALATHNNHVIAKLRQKSWQSTTSCHCEEQHGNQFTRHCETFRSWQSIFSTSLRDFRQKIVAIQYIHTKMCKYNLVCKIRVKFSTQIPLMHTNLFY